MKRVDRLIGEARLHRIRRAAKARGMAVSDPHRDWMDDADVASLILRDLQERPVPDAASPASLPGARPRAPVDVLDLSLLRPFVDRCVAAIEAIAAELDPKGLIAADCFPKVCAIVSLDPAAPSKGDGREAGRARRGAVDDVAALAVETALFEVVRRLQVAADRDRPLASGADVASIVFRKGRVVRLRAPASDAVQAGRAPAPSFEAGPVAPAIPAETPS